MTLITIAALGAAFSARYPNAGTVNLEASVAEPGIVAVEAAAFRGFSSGSSKIVPVKALENFFVAGQVIAAGDIVEVPEPDANYLCRQGQASFATDADISSLKKAK